MTAIIEEAFYAQREFYRLLKTRPLEFRIQQLKALYRMVESHQQDLTYALQQDLGRPHFDATLTEIAPLLTSLKTTIRNLPKWTRKIKVKTPLYAGPARSEIRIEPLGQTLIIAPWNYPISLLLSPLIGALAAGNTAILKPSELAPHCETLLSSLIGKTFSPQVVTTIRGGAETAQSLLKMNFDFIFFTGGANIGRLVMAAAAKNLTPVCLELGGKSPCLVDPTAQLDIAAKRIVWGKFLNLGQTCIAPDYVYVHKSVIQPFEELLIHYTKKFFPESHHPARIINLRHFDRLCGLIENKKVLCGGRSDRQQLYIEPTILKDISWSDAVMEEEIFGPILPIMTYSDLDQTLATIKARPKPLAAYFFSSSRAQQEKLLEELSFGGSCVNDCLMHYSNTNLPFGGVGESGMGSYHGRAGFDLFSHKKSVYRASTRIDIAMRYPPYTEQNRKWIQRVMRWL